MPLVQHILEYVLGGSVSLVEVTLCGGSKVVLEGSELQALRRVLTACQLLGIDDQHTVRSADPRGASAWVLRQTPSEPRVFESPHQARSSATW